MRAFIVYTACAALSAASSVANITHVPLRIDSKGQLSIAANLPHGYGDEMILSMGDINCISGTTLSDEMRSISLQSDSGDQIPVMLKEESTRFFEYDWVPLYLRVGPQSELVQQYGSVSIIKSGPEPRMVIDGGYHLFSETCDPGSIVRFNGTERFPSTISTTGVVTEWVLKSVEHDFGLQFHGTKRMIVPEIIYSSIVHKIRRTGATFLDFPVYKVSRCDVDIFDRLPSIKVEFGDGVIELHPNQYLKLDESEKACSLKIAPLSATSDRAFMIGPDEGRVGFNPLLIPGMNVYVGRSGMVGVCSSREL